MSKAIILFTIILMDLLCGMEFDLFVPSFPALQAYFQISSFWVEALLSINFIGYCLSLFLVGSLADRYGRKPMLLVGLTIFVIGGLVCLWSSAFYGMLLGRFLHGIGIAAPSILSFLIIADNYPLDKQQRFMALLNGVMNISVAVAPLIGSYITLYFHWQGNFIALTLLGLLVLVLTFLFIPNYALPQRQATSKSRGYLGLLKSRPLMLLISHIILMIVPYWIFVGMTPLLYLKAFGVSLTHFGYYQGSLALVFALGSFLLGWIFPRCKQKTWFIGAIIIFMFSFLSLGLVTWVNSTNPLFITLALMPFIIGQIPASLLFPLCLNYISDAKGQISAMIQGGRLIFCAIALQVTGFYYQGSFQPIGLMMLGVIAMVNLTLLVVIKYWHKFEKAERKKT